MAKRPNVPRPGSEPGEDRPAVAGPLFLIVMVAIFVLIGSGDMIILQAIIYMLLPVASLGFMVGLKSMIPEV